MLCACANAAGVENPKNNQVLYLSYNKKKNSLQALTRKHILHGMGLILGLVWTH